jgi:hypothetical protein
MHELAIADARTITQALRETQGSRAALAWVDALQLALAHVSHLPSGGDAEHALSLGLPKLRGWQLHRQTQMIW